MIGNFIMFACRLPVSTACCLAAACVAAYAGDDSIDPAKAKEHFDKADKALNVAWAAAKAALSEDEFAELKKDQRGWIEHRDYLARSPQYTGVDHLGALPLSAPEYLDAAGDLADERVAWLRGYVRKWDAKENLTGEWVDSYGGSMRIVEKDGKLFFQVQCVRGPTSHSGEIDGIAAWKKPVGRFGITSPDGDGKKTSLTFTLRHPKLELVGVNTGYYHGMRAYFDGAYVKTRALSSKEETNIVQVAKSGSVADP